jgi:mevalonate kinase
MQNRFYSNGKLILSGEYMVLHGASALVLPLKVGQEMTVTSITSKSDSQIHWQANELGEAWFSATYKFPDMGIKETSNAEIAIRLAQILIEAGKLNPHLFVPGTGYDISTNTGFKMNWGFGSSSTLIANIAEWAMIDPYELHFLVSNGSGVDIAGAVASGPVLYKRVDRKPNCLQVQFKPPFSHNIWFVYRGRKQDSQGSVRNFKLNDSVSLKAVNRIDYITLEMIQAESLEYFLSLINEHEKIMAKVLNTSTIHSTLFSDFSGEIKSLGAWGGDFIMAVSDADDSIVRSYFANKGMNPVFRFDEIVLG